MATGVVRGRPLRRPRTVRRTLGLAMPRRIARRINGPKARKKARENAMRVRSRGLGFAPRPEAPSVLIATSSTNHRTLSSCVLRGLMAGLAATSVDQHHRLADF